MTEKAPEGNKPLTGVWVNIAKSLSTTVLKNATGSHNDSYDTISTSGGEVVGDGPQKDAIYVIGAESFGTKYDWHCRAVNNPKQGDFLFAR